MTDSLTWLASILLIPSIPVVVAAIFLAGYIFHNRNMWAVAATLTLCTLAINPILKNYFQLLRPMGHEGFAFPSGHFFGSLAFYGWIALMWPNKWARIAIAFILAGIGFGLVYLGYHYVRDLCGSLVAAIILIGITSQVLKIQQFKSKPYWLASIYTLSLGIPILLYDYLVAPVPKNSLSAIIMLAIFSIVWMITSVYLRVTGRRQ